MKKLSIIIIALASFCFSTIGFTQNTVGLIEGVTGEFNEGYNLFYPLLNNTVYLTDNCGKVVNTWYDANKIPGSAFEILPDGNLLKTLSYGFVGSPSAIPFAGGAGDILALKDWDNNLLWEFTVSNDTARMHHDFEYLPNGNVLIMVWQKLSFAQIFALGRDVASIPAGGITSDFIIEVEQDGLNGGNIVWQWNVLDHLIQELDPNGANYGVVADNPQKVNVNYPNAATPNWLNSNSIEYNPTLDHILYSVPALNEIWIIDHSTTTAEAATGSGGNAGKGGDLLYRWGNPNAYNVSGDTKLGFQHAPLYLNPNAQIGDADFNKIILFNNRAGADFSAVNILTPIWDEVNNEYTSLLPVDFDFEFVADPPQDMYSNILSNAQILENGNLMVCSGTQGTVWEFNDSNQLVWKYVSPLGNNAVPIDQGTANRFSASLFRFLKYPTDYAGFDGKDMTATDYIETNSNDDVCSELYSSLEDNFLNNVKVYPIPAKNILHIENIKPNDKITIFNILGSEVKNETANASNLSINVEDLKSGIYTLSINNQTAKKLIID